MAENEVNLPEFWDESYQAGHIPWDLGGANPVLRRLFSTGEFTPGRAIVLGAGRGHDARMLARKGFQVTAVDFAPGAARDMRALADPEAPVEILQADLFELPVRLVGAYDLALEYTCFCAIDPDRRPEYAAVISRLLRPGGLLVALLFPIREDDGGPPYAVSAEEFQDLLARCGFSLRRRETPPDSVKPRRGFEELLIFRKDAGAPDAADSDPRRPI